MFQRFFYEVNLFWQFTKGDLLAVVVPSMLFSVHAVWYEQYSLLHSLNILAIATVYFWTTLLFFCISNQMGSVKEDQLNKPYRPIVSGLVAPRGALKRWVIIGVLGIFLGILLDVYWFTIVFFVSTVLHNQLRMGNHWLGRCLLTSIGISSSITAGWAIVSPLTPNVLRWTLFFGGFWVVLNPIQDLRDISGDREMNRTTMPIVFGETFTRCMLVIGFVLVPFFVHFFLLDDFASSLISNIWELVLGLLSIFLAYRVYYFRTTDEDRKTYRFFMIYFCLVIVASLFLMTP